MEVVLLNTCVGADPSLRLTTRALIVAHVLFASCTQDATRSGIVEIAFFVESDPATPVEGVSVYVDGSAVGTTDHEGKLSALVEVVPTHPAIVRYACPRGHARDESEFVVRFPSTAHHRAGRARPLEFKLRCRALTRVAVFVFRVSPPMQVPIFIDSARVGVTDEEGMAVVVGRREPQTALEAKLDTSAFPEMVPRSPVRRFLLSEGHDIFVFDQHFDAVKPGQRVRRKRARITKIE